MKSQLGLAEWMREYPFMNGLSQTDSLVTDSLYRRHFLMTKEKFIHEYIIEWKEKYNLRLTY